MVGTALHETHIFVGDCNTWIFMTVFFVMSWQKVYKQQIWAPQWYLQHATALNHAIRQLHPHPPCQHKAAEVQQPVARWRNSCYLKLCWALYTVLWVLFT